MRWLLSAALAAVALLVVAPVARGGTAEECLDAPTAACVTERFAEGADLSSRAVPPAERPWPAGAALGGAKHGRAGSAATRLAEATAIAATLDRPHDPLRRAMWQAARVSRAASAVAACRAESHR